MPIIPFIPAIIGAAGAITGGALAGRNSSSSSSNSSTTTTPLGTQTITPQQQAQQDELSAIAQIQRKWGKKDVKQGTKDFSAAQDYWSTLLGGDRTAIAQAKGPEITRVSDQYDAARKSLSEFAPRGGGRIAGLSGLAGQQAGQIGNIFLNARPEAAAAIERLGVERSGIGGNLLAGAGNDFNAILNNLLGNRAADTASRSADTAARSVELAGKNQSNALLGGLGQGLGALLLGILRNRGGSSGGTSGGSGIIDIFGEGGIGDIAP